MPDEVITPAVAIPADLAASLEKYTDDDFDGVASSGYLPRLQLMTSSSEKCKAGEFKINNYALVSDSNYIDLGTEVDCWPIVWRPKAIEMGDSVITVFDQKSEQFRDIAKRADVQNSGCMYGIEFLIWLPKVGEFCTFFMGSKSARREARNVKARLREPSTLKSHKLQNTSYTWYAAIITACSTPFDLPDPEAMIEQIESFNNPPAPTAEKVAEGESDGRER